MKYYKYGMQRHTHTHTERDREGTERLLNYNEPSSIHV